MYNKLHIVGVILITFLILLLQPMPVVQADGTVDDLLEDNDHQLDDKDMNTDDKKDEGDKPGINENDTQSDQTGRSGSLFMVIVKMVFALLLILGIIYGLLQFLKKKNKLFVKSNTLENIGGITVGSNKSMQIVRIGSRFFVIGVGENVEILHEITDEKVVHDLMDKEGNNQGSSSRILASLTPEKFTRRQADHHFKTLFSRELANLKQNREKIINENKEDTHE